MVSHLNSSGNSPRIHNIAALPQSPRVTVEIECNTREIHWTDHLHVNVQRHFMGIQNATRKNASQMLNSFLSMQRDSEQDSGHSSDLDRRKSGTLLVKTVHRKNETNC